VITLLPIFGVTLPPTLTGIVKVIEAGLAAGDTISEIIAAVIASLIPTGSTESRQGKLIKALRRKR